MTDHKPDVSWRDDKTPVSRRFDDPYFSVVDGLAETRHVFLDGNDLPQRFAPGFQIAELGFGTGLNALAAWQAWREAGVDGALHFTSFEAYPLSAKDMARALDGFASLGATRDLLCAAVGPAGGRYEFDGLILDLIVGDARMTLAQWQGRADAWFLDGFSPAKNPELWEPGLMSEVAGHTKAGGTLATYSAAGAVRRALEAAGFGVTRVHGFGKKRHMTRGVLR